MANKTILALMASAIAAGGFSAAAQNNDVVLTSETISVTEVPDCKVHYYNSYSYTIFLALPLPIPSIKPIGRVTICRIARERIFACTLNADKCEHIRAAI